MEDAIKLRIKTLDGREHSVEIERRSTIIELKEKIESLTGVAQGSQRIIFQGRILTDDLTIGTSGLENNSAVHLVERIPPVSSDNAQGSYSEITRNSGKIGFLNSHKQQKMRNIQAKMQVNDGPVT